jgi:hypothetical protein
LKKNASVLGFSQISLNQKITSDTPIFGYSIFSLRLATDKANAVDNAAITRINNNLETPQKKKNPVKVISRKSGSLVVNIL